AEHVAQLALVSTLLPHTNRSVANEYRWVLAVGLAGTALLAAVGLLAAAVVIAAFVLPVTYLVFAHDVELWGAHPGTPIGALYFLSAIGSVLVSLLFFGWIGADAFSGLLFADAHRGG